MEKLYYYLASWPTTWLTKPDSDEQEEVATAATGEEDVFVSAMGEDEVVASKTEEEEVWEDFSKILSGKKMEQTKLFWKKRKTHLRARIFAKYLYYEEEFRCPETIRQLSKDLVLATATVREYVKFFVFERFLDTALRSFLSVFWPKDEPEIQHLLISHFSHRYLTCAGLPLTYQLGIYNLTWAMIMLNADLHGGHKGRKKTCKEFIANLNNMSHHGYPAKELAAIYNSIKEEPLRDFRVKTQYQTASKKKTSIPEESGSNSTGGTDDNPTTTVHKKGNLVCKRVKDENGRKTRKGRRAWKPFAAVLKGMVLHLQKDASDLCKADNKNAIRLHHAVAYPVDHRKRPHAFCLRTADSRLSYFQAKSEAEQASWIAIINRIAARYSAPPLVPVSHNTKAHCPQVLPSFPTNLSLEQQLKYYKDRSQKLSESMDYSLTLHQYNYSSLDHVEQEVKRYTTYVRALEECVAEEGFSHKDK